MVYTKWRVIALGWGAILVIWLAAACEPANDNQVECTEADCLSSCQEKGFAEGSCQEQGCACERPSVRPYQWQEEPEDPPDEVDAGLDAGDDTV